MKLAFAEACAKKLVEWLQPFAKEVHVAGSIRRRREVVNDIDLVIVPAHDQETDLYGKVLATRNATEAELRRRAEAEKWAIRCRGDQVWSGTHAGIQVDVFWASPLNVGTVLVCRTGSAGHNAWLAEQATAVGARWHPHVGMYLQNVRFSETEERVYGALGLPVLDPATQRDEPHFRRFRSRRILA